MSRFNTTTMRPAKGRGPIVTEPAPTACTALGAPGWRRDTKSELFLLAVSNMVGQHTFHEDGATRDGRFEQLAAAAAVEDPQWTADCLKWVRTEGFMRSAPLVAGLEGARALVAAKAPGGRQIVDGVLQRPDEPGEAIAYWLARYGRTIPFPVKNGVADAALRLYTERALVKWDTRARAVRFGDVLDLCHPKATADWQRALFEYALARRRGRDIEVPAALPTVQAYNALIASPDPQAWLDTERLAAAGATWEDALSAAGPSADRRRLWTALIPVMGYGALLKNLRNFDDDGLPDEVADQVAARLTDPAQVQRSRQFPIRFYAAHQAVRSLRWAYPLEKALGLSLTNIPVLPGRTLVLVDQSPSMFPGYPFSSPQQHPGICNADLAKLFGSAIALRAADATLAGYGANSYRVPLHRGDALLKVMERFRVDDGTDTFSAVHAHFDGHDRVVIVTDEQNQASRYSSINDVVPRDVPVYVWNIGGYQVGSTAAGVGRFTFGGLSDAGFRMVDLIERGRNAAWPWQAEN